MMKDFEKVEQIHFTCTSSSSSDNKEVIVSYNFVKKTVEELEYTIVGSTEVDLRHLIQKDI